MSRTAYDWSKLFNLFQPPAPNPQTSPAAFRDLTTVLSAIGEAVWNGAVLRQDALITRQVTVVAKAHGVGGYLPYIWYSIFRQSKNWPAMSFNDQRGLVQLSRILVMAGSVPSYSAGLTVPPDALEGAVDETLKSLAGWMTTGFRETVKKSYLSIIEKFTPEASAAMNLTSPNAAAVRSMFESVLKKDPRAISTSYGGYLSTII